MQQLMTLSAGGLAMYFSFIEKTTFIQSIGNWGVMAVVSWVISLTSSAMGHWFYSKLFNSSFEVYALNTRTASLLEDMDRITHEELNENKNKSNIDAKKVKEEIIDISNKANSYFYTFRDIQKKLNLFVNVSLIAFIFGFILLLVAYAKTILCV